MLVSITNKKTAFKSMKIDSKRSALMFKRSVHSTLLFFIEKFQLSSFSKVVFNRFFTQIRRRPAGRVILL